MSAPETLFAIVVKYVARNLILVESWSSFPDLIAEIVVRRAAKEHLFCQDTENVSEIFYKLAKEYSDFVAPTISINNTALVWEYERRLVGLLQGVKELDLSGTRLEKDTILHEFAQQATKCRVLRLKNAGIRKDIIRWLTGPMLLSLHQSCYYHVLELVDIRWNELQDPLLDTSPLRRLPTVKKLLLSYCKSARNFSSTLVLQTLQREWGNACCKIIPMSSLETASESPDTGKNTLVSCVCVSQRKGRRLMTHVNVAGWQTEEVCQWLTGVDQKVRCYTRYFTKFGVNGRRLLVMDASDLATMGIWKVGHQEIILGAIALLKHCHFVLQKENLQTLFLELGAKASSLARQLHLRQGELGTGDTVQPAPSSRGPYSSVVSYVTSNGVTKRDRKGGVSTDCIAAVADLMISLKQCITWLDRAPFRHQPSMDSLKRELLTVAVQLAATTQRDFFADEPEGNIAVMCGKLESTCEQMVQCATDSLVITPASLELVKIAKKDDCDNELGLHISSSFKGVHSVGMVSRDVLQRAHGRVQEGDDILRVDHQTVVGWQLMEVVALIRRSGREVSLTVKRQPHHVTPQRRKVYPASVAQKRRQKQTKIYYKIRPLRHNPASSISASTPPSVTSTPAKTACKTQLPQHTEEEQGGGSSGGQSTASPSSSASLTPSSVVMAPSVSSHFEEDGTKEPAPIRLASEEDDDVPPSPPPVPPRLMLEHVSSPSNAQRKQSLLSAKPMIVRRATVIGIQPSMGSTEATEFEEDDQIDVPLEETVISRGIVTRTISAPPIKKSGPPPPLVVPSTADTPHHQSPQPPPTPPRSSAPPPIPERRPTMVTPSTPALPPRQQPPPSPSLIVTKASDVQQSSVFNPVYHSPPPGQPPITPPRKEPPSPPPALPARLHPPPPGRRVPPPPPPPPRQPTSSSPRIVAAASAFSSSESSCTSGAHSQFPGLNRDRMTTYRRPGVSSANPQTSNTVTISGRITSGNWRLGNRSSTEPSPGDLCAVPNRYECVPSSSPPAPMARRSVGGPIVTTAAEGPISPSSEQSSTLSSPASSSISWHSSSSSTTAGHGGGTTTTNSSATSSPPLRHQPPPGHAYSHLPHSSSSSSSLSSTSSTGVPPSHDSLLTIGEGCLSTTPTSSSTAVSPSSSTLTASHSSSSSLNRESVVTALDPPPVFVPAQMRPGIQQLQPTPESQNRRPGSGAIDSTRLH